MRRKTAGRICRPPASASRRTFLKQTVAAVVGGGVLEGSPWAEARSGSVAIVVDPRDAALQRGPVSWAAGQLREALEARGLVVRLRGGSSEPGAEDEQILVARPESDLAQRGLGASGASVHPVPEALSLVRGRGAARRQLLVSGTDERGLVYGLLELADRVTHASDPLQALRAVERVVQRPANPIRSVARLFTSEPEDKPWFHDQGFWRRYLTMLARERFNRVSLTLGLGYNSPRRVRDSYFYFAYPFLLSLPGYSVKARGLPEEERERNLAMLRWIAEEATARGLRFQLALWTHAYELVESPEASYLVEGLTPENHPAYCRAAIRRLLEACPAISGVTLRCHSESGVPEGSHDFWRHVFDGIAGCGRRVEIDIHSKGIDHELIGVALATGLPVYVSPKYWAEHMGPPYHQAAVREQERPRPAAGAARIEQQRRFTRYGYGDYLREDRAYGVYYRIWPGTQRLLLWGDPATAAGYGRQATFCGSLGLELFEPLSFKGRMGSGKPGGREPYRDPALNATGGDFEKYLYGYRLWGRLLYDPDEYPETWRPLLRSQLGAGAADAEAALAHASRVLPLVTVAHHPSASNNRYWPEIYTDMPIVDANRPHPYTDTPSPRRFVTVSPLDPALFSRIVDFAEELVTGERSAKYSPVEVALWLETFAQKAEDHLARARQQVAKAEAPGFRRWAIDIAGQAGLGRFFAHKLRAGVAYALYESTRDRTALEEALRQYRSAREAWKSVIAATRGPYQEDLTFGGEPYLRGHWADRLAAIEADLADMERAREATSGAKSEGNGAGAAPAWKGDVSAVLAGPRRTPPGCVHAPPEPFRRGEPVALELSLPPDRGLDRVRLHYRHVNQAEEYQVAEMTLEGDRCRGTIPGHYSDSPYPLLYFFELRDRRGGAWLYPGFEEDLANQPYFVVRAAGRVKL